MATFRDEPAYALGIGRFSATVTHDDAATGASTAVALTGMPTGKNWFAVKVDIDESFAGEADVAITSGNGTDPDGFLVSLSLNAVPVGSPVCTGGALLHGGVCDLTGADITFTATELGDLTAGQATIHYFYLND